METERISILIDGGNFYHLVIKKLGVKENDFDFDAFANSLIDGRETGENCKRFYKGSIREKEGDLHSKDLMSEQTRLFTALKKSNWDIKTSKLRTRVEELKINKRVFEYKELKKIGLETIHTEKEREKGIDVKIAVDLLVGAFDNKYDTAIIVSSDSDLIPAIDWIRRRTKKKVEYIGFSIPDLNDPKKSTTPLMAMFSKTNTQRVFSDIEMRKFIKVSKMGFHESVVPQVFDGKISTWRLRDHKLKEGDVVDFENSQTGEIFGKGKITEVSETTVGDIDLEDKKHYKTYKNRQELIEAFKRHNPNYVIDDNTLVYVYTYKFTPILKNN